MKARSLFWSTGALGALLLTAGCARSGDATTQKLVITGSSTIAPLIVEISALYEELHPGIRIDVQTGGSSRGIADARSGIADLGMSSRDLRDGEAPGLQSHLLAWDGIAFVVESSNPIEALDDAELRAIYTGKVTDWAEVGGRAGPITVVHRAAGRSEVDLVAGYLGITEADIAATIISGENQHALKTVASDPSAIVYVSVGAAEHAASNGQPLRPLPLRGIEASAAEVASGAYPLARPLNLLTLGSPSELAGSFLDFARSQQTEDLVRGLSYVPATS